MEATVKKWYTNSFDLLFRMGEIAFFSTLLEKWNVNMNQASYFKNSMSYPFSVATSTTRLFILIVYRLFNMCKFGFYSCLI